VTREQAAKLLVRTMELLTGQKLDASAAPGYTDAAKISKWAAPYVSAATAAGLLRGDVPGPLLARVRSHARADHGHPRAADRRAGRAAEGRRLSLFRKTSGRRDFAAAFLRPRAGGARVRALYFPHFRAN
jgi:hypothetical protein